MKKICSLLLVVTLILSLCACGGNANKKAYDPSEGNVLITDDMVDEIRAAVLDKSSKGKLSFLFESDALSCANARIEISSGYEHIKKFTSIKITSEGFQDKWHYNFYGTIYGKDTYNKDVSYDFKLVVLCAEDSTEEKGYKIKRDGISINIK